MTHLEEEHEFEFGGGADEVLFLFLVCGDSQRVPSELGVVASTGRMLHRANVDCRICVHATGNPRHSVDEGHCRLSESE